MRVDIVIKHLGGSPLMDIKQICFIVPNYPIEGEQVYTFVKQIISAIADLGIGCTVIAPQSLSNRYLRKSKNRPLYWEDETINGNKISIYQPKYISFSNLKLNGISISSYFRKKSIEKTYNKIDIKPDLLYAHFWHSAVIAGSIALEYNLPLFVASGESQIRVKDMFNEKVIKKNLKPIRGVICVSSKNKQESLNLNLASDENMIVIPNAIDHNKFYPINKIIARNELGYEQNDFIVAYTGAFNDRKGILRLSKAVDMVTNVKTIYIGSGSLVPENDNILFMGRLPHEKIALYLNAADVFVLPTLAEGCCNAIIEAMACGLPIVSSNLLFNYEILNQDNSIMVNPNNIEEIAMAINHLKNNPGIRESMSQASLIKAKELNIESRAKSIIEYIQKRC